MTSKDKEGLSNFTKNMNMPGFLTLNDYREFNKQLKLKQETKNFNLLTNIYLENDDKNYIFNKQRVGIYEGKYFKTFLVDSNLGKFPAYNKDPKSKEFQQLIEDSAKSKDYFKIGNFYMNSADVLDLRREFKKKLIEDEDMREIYSKYPLAKKSIKFVPTIKTTNTNNTNNTTSINIESPTNKDEQLKKKKSNHLADYVKPTYVFDGTNVVKVINTSPLSSRSRKNLKEKSSSRRVKLFDDNTKYNCFITNAKNIKDINNNYIKTIDTKLEPTDRHNTENMTTNPNINFASTNEGISTENNINKTTIDDIVNLDKKYGYKFEKFKIKKKEKIEVENKLKFQTKDFFYSNIKLVCDNKIKKLN